LQKKEKVMAIMLSLASLLHYNKKEEKDNDNVAAIAFFIAL
jgi:hypothetical protein